MDKSKLAANILSGQDLNFKNNNTPKHLQDNVYPTPVPKYVQEGQLGISINMFGTREGLIDQFYKMNGVVTPDNVDNQEFFDFMKEEFYQHRRMVALISNLDLHPYTDYQHPGQRAAVRQSLGQANIFAATIVDFDFEEFKFHAAKEFEAVSFENIKTFEEAVAKIREKYRREYCDHSIVNKLWHSTVNLEGNPLKLSFTE